MFTNTDTTAAQSFVDRVNAEYAAGRGCDVNGKRVKTWGSRKPAQVWQNGSVSVDVAKNNGQVGGTVWVKVGQSAGYAFTETAQS